MESAGAEAVYRSIVAPTGLPADGKPRAARVPDTWPLPADTVAEQPGTRDSTPPCATTDTRTHTHLSQHLPVCTCHTDTQMSRDSFLRSHSLPLPLPMLYNGPEILQTYLQFTRTTTKLTATPILLQILYAVLSLSRQNQQIKMNRKGQRSMFKLSTRRRILYHYITPQSLMGINSHGNGGYSHSHPRCFLFPFKTPRFISFLSYYFYSKFHSRGHL